MIKLNNKEIIVTMFPDKTSQVWKIIDKSHHQNNYIEWIYEHEGEIFHLLQLSMLLNKENPQVERHLYIPYLPYARQDKEISDSATFALLPFTNILNMCGFDKVTILDPHSTEATRLINNSIAIYPTREVMEAVIATKTSCLFYPDKGALKKYKSIYPFDYLSGTKVRDPKSGLVLSHNITGDVFGKTLLIVDDICDGGATFIGLTKCLLEMGAKEINLFVTHGLFSKGMEVLYQAGICRIFTKNGEA